MARHTSMTTGHGPPHRQGGAVHTVHRHDGTTKSGQSLIGGISNAPQSPAQGAGPGPTPAAGAGVPPVIPPEMMPR